MIQIENITEVEKHLEGIRAVVFDVDDTLHTEADYARAAFQAVAAYIPEVDGLVDKLMAVHKQRGRALQTVLSAENMADRAEEAFRIYSAYTPDKVELYPGVMELFRSLREQGFKLGIITDGKPEGQRKKLHAMGLDDGLFDAIIVTDELGGPQYRKPRPEAFIRMRELLDIPYEQTAYVGDNPDRDIPPCEELGIRAIHFNNPKGFYYQGVGENRLPTCALAVDIGASSVRGVLGRYNGKSLVLEELGRFPTPFVKLGPVSYWDFPAIFNHVISLIRTAQEKCFVRCVGIDSFGGAVCFIDREGRLLENPVYTHGPSRCVDRETARAEALFSAEEASAAAGFDLGPEYRQALKMKAITALRPGFDMAVDKVLFMSSAVGYYLCGRPYVEMSQLTAQQWSAFTKTEWNHSLAAAMGLREGQCSPVVDAGTKLGELTEEIREEHGLKPCQVIAVAEHDTASAMSLLAEEKRAAFLSLGTMVVLSVPVHAPVLTDSAAEARFINEGGAGLRLTRNLNGLVFVRRCRAVWEQQGLETGYEFLEAEAEECLGGRYVFDPALPKFRGVEDIPSALNEHFGTALTQGETIRSVYDSLALSVAENLERMERETGCRYDVLCAVGGGIRSRLLCRCIAAAAGRPVKAVSAEGAAVGSICTQLIALGAMGDMDEAITAMGAEAFYDPNEL